MTQAAVSRTLHLALVLERDVLPIAGTLQGEATQPQRFDGWLELIAAIEAFLSVAREHEHPPPTPEPGTS